MIEPRFLVRGHPAHLAAIRIALFTFLLARSFEREPRDMATLPEALRNVPTGAGWLFTLLPPNDQLAYAGSALMAAAALAAVVGWHGRIAAAAWALAAVWVHGIPNLYGKVDHNHHLIWFAALLAATRCTDALSFDARRARLRGEPSPEPHVRYGFPVRVWWLLMGLIYLFPGLAKVAAQGLGWASPTNIEARLHSKWTSVDPAIEPLMPIDDWPLAMVGMGLFTLVFEIAFIVVVFTRFRRLAVVAGVVFHLGTYLFLDIAFPSLLVCYLALLPWEDGEAVYEPPPATSRRGAPDRVTVAVAALLVSGGLAFGLALDEHAWPFASYPTFAERPAAERATLVFERELPGGEVVTLGQDEVFGWVSQSRRPALVRRVLDLDEASRSKVLADVPLPEVLRGGTVRVLAQRRSIDPETSAITSSEVIAELEVPAGRP